MTEKERGRKRKFLGFEVEEKEFNAFVSICKRTGLNKSLVMRLLLRDFYDKIANDSTFPLRIRQQMLYMSIRRQKKAIKQLREVAHLKVATEQWIKRIEKIDKGKMKEAIERKFKILTEIEPFYRAELQKREKTLLKTINNYKSSFKKHKKIEIEGKVDG